MSKVAAAMAKKAHAAVMAAKAYQARPLPAGLRHLCEQQKAITRQKAAALPIGVKLIRALVDVQLGICPYCDDWLEFDPEFGMVHPLRPSIDHVMPRSRGGQSVGNKLAMHRECNTAKGDRLPNGCELVWLATVNARLGL